MRKRGNKMLRKIVFLHPIGPQGSPITSHTLFGATCWAWATLGEDVGQLVSGWATQPGLAYSHAFPYLRRNPQAKPVLVLPKPPLRPPLKEVNALIAQGQPQADKKQDDKSKQITDMVDLAKKVQQATWMSQGVAARWRNGDLRAGTLLREVDSKRLKLYHGILCLPEEVPIAPNGSKKNAEGKPLWKKTIVQRNSIDRVAGATAEGLLFQEEQTFYCPGRAGLWAALWADDALWPKVEAALRLIADTGLGGERTVGKGHFCFEVVDWEAYFPPVPTAKRFVSLADYIPAPADGIRPIAYTLRQIRQKAENRYPDGAQRVYVAQLQTYQPGSLFESGVQQELYGGLTPLGQVGSRRVYYHSAVIPLWGEWEE